MTSIAATDTVKKGDDVTLTYRVNADLTGANTVKWLARRSADGPTLLSVDATFAPGADASTVTVELGSAQTSTVGIWLVEIEVMNGGKRHTFPSKGYGRLQVIDDLS